MTNERDFLDARFKQAKSEGDFATMLHLLHQMLRDPRRAQELQEFNAALVDDTLDDLKMHTEPMEGMIQDLTRNEMWLGEYLAVRVTSHGFGLKFACGANAEDVYLAVREDRKNNPQGVYYLYKPVIEGQDREALLFGGTD